MTTDLILRLAAIGAALVLAGLATWAAIKSDDADGCLPIILGGIAFLLLVGAFASGPVVGP